MHGVAKNVQKCDICRMKVDARTHFEGIEQENKKPVHFCSFICAHQYRRKDAKAPLSVYDFGTGKKVNADKAFFLVKSKNIANELGFGMPPLVVGFVTKADADKVQKRLADGNVVEGFNAVQKTYK